MEYFDKNFSKDEELLRALWPITHPKGKALWVKDGVISTSAFKDPNGCSVDRTAGRDLEEAVSSMRKRFHGSAAVVTVGDCEDKPSVLLDDDKPYHVQLYRSETEVLLSNDQCFDLAEAANQRKPRKIPE